MSRLLLLENEDFGKAGVEGITISSDCQWKMKNESKEIAGAVPLNWVFENNSIAFISLQTKFGEQKELKNCHFYFGLEKK